MQEQKNKEKGITLIALVVTIIVLIILAGVSMNMLIGDNGIITMAQQAKGVTQEADRKERMQLYQLEAKMQEESTLKDILVEKGLLKENQLQELEEEGITTLEDNVLVVQNYNGLKALSQNSNNGNSYANVTIYLLNDIDGEASFNSETGELLSGENFTPIGNSTNFNGTLDGLGYTIKNIYIKEESSSADTGLIGIIGNKGKVENLTIADSYIQGYAEVGAIAGQNRGTIINCENRSMVVSDYLEAAGIAGKCIHSGTIKNSANYGTVYNKGRQTGGIVAWARSVTIKNCYNIGTLTGTSLGGIIGSYADNLSLSNCYWLESCGADYGIFSAQSDENAESKSSDEMKLLVTTLGEEWKEDEGSINKGYPILQWQ